MAGPFQVGHNRVVIDAPARLVFDYLADLSHIMDWGGEPNFQITRMPDGPPAEGSLMLWERSGIMQGPLILRGGMGESRVTLEKRTTIALYSPHSSLVIETRNIYNGLLHSIERFKFELDELGGTQVSMVSEIEAMVPSIFIGPVYAIRVVRNIFGRLLGGRMAGFLPQATAGPHLSRVKDKLETPRPAGTS
jgi:hypothetical protein